jgi:hypothetical protein
MSTTDAPIMPTFDDLRWWMNTVRPLRSADLVAAESVDPLPGLTMRIELHRGRSSSGYKSDYDRVETWWVINWVTRHDAPHRLFGRGTRYSGKSCEAKARQDYAGAVLAAKGGA